MNKYYRSLTVGAGDGFNVGLFVGSSEVGLAVVGFVLMTLVENGTRHEVYLHVLR